MVDASRSRHHKADRQLALVMGSAGPALFWPVAHHGLVCWVPGGDCVWNTTAIPERDRRKPW